MYIAIPSSDEPAIELARLNSNSQEHVPQVEQFEQESDRLTLAPRPPKAKISPRAIVKTVVGGLLLSSSGFGFYQMYEHIVSSTVHIPKADMIPSLIKAPSSFTLTDSGIFAASPHAVNATNQAEMYLNQSIHARNLFDRLAQAGYPVPLHGSRAYSHEYQGVIGWSFKELLESHNQQFNATSQSCGTNSAALLLAHEAEHSDWARSNPLGQRLLTAMDGYPFYDNLEEARSIRATNRIAIDLGESQRGTHHGRHQEAKSVTDTNGGICSDGNLDSEQHNIESAFRKPKGFEYKQLFDTSASNLNILSLMEPYAHLIPQDLMLQLDGILHERSQAFLQLSQKVSKEAISDVDFKRILAPHIDNAIAVASQFRGIGIDMKVKPQSIHVH